MPKLRLGVIGAGSWAVSSHLPNFAKRRDEVEFVGVCRKGPELLEKIGPTSAFGMASEDYRDVIAAGMDICLVSSPHGLHYEHAKAALEAGAHDALRRNRSRSTPPRPGTSSRRQTASAAIYSFAYGWNYFAGSGEAKRLMDRAGDRRDRAVGDFRWPP
jgi:hypothetical protein